MRVRKKQVCDGLCMETDVHYRCGKRQVFGGVLRDRCILGVRRRDR